MSARLRRSMMTGLTCLVLLALGAGVAFVLTDALGIRSEPSEVPRETSAVAEVRDTVAPPAFTAIDAPRSERMTWAVQELTVAVSEAPRREGETTLTVTWEASSAGHGAATTDDGYKLGGTPTALTITAATEAGAVRGVYDLAAAVRDGRSVTEHLGETVTSALPFRMVDLGAVGVAIDEQAYADGTDYSHNSNAFEDVILPDAPYVDAAALEEARVEFEQYVHHVLAEGATAIAIPGFIEYLTFDELGVYDDGDDHVARALAMQQAFGPLWQYAHDLGLKTYFRTDMLALTTPFERYLTDRFGSLDTENPQFWDAYATGLDELYASMPYIDGVLIRIGEAGQVYDLPEWDYYSALSVTTVPAVRAMLTSFTEQAERADREVIFRTWSVGVGAVGDMHTSTDSYHAVLDGIDSPNLIVSTKYTRGDFYSYLPYNDTLETGDHRRIIEFQSRREFENFGAFPNDLGGQYRDALQRFIAANPNIEGVWVWTQDGGPWRAGPLILELKAGLWQLAELNTELGLRLARDPAADPASITADWARRWFSDDPATVTAIAEAMAESRAAITDGLYIGPFAERQVAAIGLHPPPMMWLFEWDILTGDSAVLDVIYSISRDDLDEAIDAGDRAVAAVGRMRERLAGTDAASWKSEELRQSFLATLDYQQSTFELLADYREMILRQAEWHDTNDPAAYAAWAAAKDAFTQSADAHEAAYAGDPYHPAYNLTAARLGVERAERDLAMAWFARILLALVALWVLLGALSRLRLFARIPARRAARALWIAATRPWRAGEVTAPLTRTDRILLVAVPGTAIVLSQLIATWFLAPAHLVVVFGSWLLFGAAVLLAAPHARWAALAALGGTGLLRTLPLLIALAPTGPGGYWFGFWTDELSRSVYVTITFALFLWQLVATGWALAASIGARRATGVVLAASGLVLAVMGALIGAIGAEGALTAWNDQMGLLPWGLSRILGITVYLEIPADTPWFAAAFGAVLLVMGALLAIPGRRQRLAPAR